MNVYRKLVYILFLIGLLLTLVASLSAPLTNAYYLYVLLFLLFYWQRGRLYQLLGQRAKSKLLHFAGYLLVSLLWALFLVMTRWQPAFGNRLWQSYIVELGFYLPYFIFWYLLQSRKFFSYKEIFTLAGLSRILFEGTITRSLYVPLALASTHGVAIALIAFILKVIATFYIFGMLTLIPLLVFIREGDNKDKGYKAYLLGLGTGFAAAVVFIGWVLVLKYATGT